MALPSGSTLTNATCTRAWLDFPFKDRGDTSTKVYNHFMEVKALNYTSLSDNDTMTTATDKPENSPFSDDANAFWVGDSIPEPLDGGMISFIRTFANIPESKQEGAGVYAFAFPGNSDTTKVSTYTQNGVSKGIVNGRPEVSFTATATNAQLLGIGDKFTLRTGTSTRGLFQATAYGTSGTQTFGPRWVIYSKTESGSNFIIKAYAEGHEAFVNSSWVFTTFTGFVVERITLEGRSGPTPVNASSILNYRYVKTDNINDEKLETAFQVINAPNGVTTPTVVDDLTANTYPSLNIYNGMVFRGAYIAAEDEVARRWKGNIWEIIGRKAVAR